MIWEWLGKILGKENEADKVDSEIEVKKAEAKEALEKSKIQVSETQEIRKESRVVGHRMRQLNKEDYFAHRVRQTFLEGR